MEAEESTSVVLQDSWLARFPGRAHAFMAQEPVGLGALIKAFVASRAMRIRNEIALFSARRRH